MISSHVKISYLITFLVCPFNYTKIYLLFIYLFTNFAKDNLAEEISQNYCSNNETPKTRKKKKKKKKKQLINNKV